ncbi:MULTISPECIES: hypothetical protein [unclassified Clostridium]|jgi:hypothetical protein|uniref:hypothetical protein n=1 Tax=unclassified Clostridium TaxID=2614128 RepID=UPI00110685AF|nr:MULTISPECIES: hypothetical protein [unclassified Clostridium]
MDENHPVFCVVQHKKLKSKKQEKHIGNIDRNNQLILAKSNDSIGKHEIGIYKYNKTCYILDNLLNKLRNIYILK